MTFSPEEFRPEEFRVDPEVAKAESLPARAFLDPDFLQRELETVFKRSWLLVPERASGERETDARPLAAQLEARGSRVPFSLLGKPLFLQRGWDDEELRCFPNTCTHAWYP